MKKWTFKKILVWLGIAWAITCAAILCLSCASYTVEGVGQARRDSIRAAKVEAPLACVESDRRVTFVVVGFGLAVMVIAWDMNDRP